ncbi:MAG TPA: Uma2 family endonuclease [Polyangiaceae bacterium]|nr:Uma2 family endonuclease [Polyangiaceae bacterium]
MAEPAALQMSYADYLALERASDVKHEWEDGTARAMSGGTPEHGRLAVRFTALLGAALGDRPCEAFSSDVKVRIAAANRSYYPDASVVCGALQRAADDADAIANPIVVVEVLSDSTEARDRGVKRRHYQLLTSLKEYVLVSQSEPFVEVWRRTEDGWSVHEYGPAGTVRLQSIDVAISVDELYRSRLPASS